MKQLVVFYTLAVVVSASAAPRPMTAEDLWKVKRVGSPSVAPDGLACVVDVTTFNIDRDDSSSNLWVLSTDGKTQKQLTNTTGRNSGPRWSPDGRWIAFVSQRAGDEGPQVYVIAPSGGEARRVSNMPMAPSGLKWAPDSKGVQSLDSSDLCSFSRCLGGFSPDTLGEGRLAATQVGLVARVPNLA